MAMAAVSKGGNHLRDASFSSYLDTADTDFVRSLAASMHGASPVFTPSRQSSSSSPSHTSMSKRRTRGPQGELNVFGAESYFGDHHERTPSFRSVDSHRNGVEEHKSKLRTQSIRSESTWSTRSGTTRNTDQIKPKKSLAGPWFLTRLQCRGSCYDVKETQEQAPSNPSKGFWEDQVIQINSQKPKHNKQTERILPSFAFPNIKENQEEAPRKSIEVFGSHRKTQNTDEEDTGDMSFTKERKQSMQSWDAIPLSSQHNRRNSGSCRFDDMDSDASSDLFDIQVFPAEMSPVTAPYEPSEASIEWSVVTASAAGFSAISDLDEDRQTPMDIIKHKTKPKTNTGILGCKSDKAVKVIAPSNSRMKSSYPPLPPKKTATFTPFSSSSSPSSSARAPRAIYMY